VNRFTRIGLSAARWAATGGPDTPYHNEFVSVSASGSRFAPPFRLMFFVVDASCRHRSRWRALARECIEVGRAEGTILDDDLIEAILATYRDGPPDAINSLHAD
jgi:hypothetical protein